MINRSPAACALSWGLAGWLARLAGLEPVTGCLEGTAGVSRMVADLGNVQLLIRGRASRSGRVGVSRGRQFIPPIRHSASVAEWASSHRSYWRTQPEW